LIIFAMSSGTRLFEANVRNLAEIRHFVAETATALAIQPAMIPSLQLAVDEAATNIIVHGYEDQPGTIEIEIHRTEGALSIRLCDNAPLFDPTSVPPPRLHVPLEQTSPGGLGVYLIRQTVDEMIYHVTPQGGNELILIKRLADHHLHCDPATPPPA
jgi:serine/threonine-protein kinase RsbW